MDPAQTTDPLNAAQTAPKFPARDPASAANWYRDVLRFPDAMVFGEGEYAIVRRGDLCLHFWRCKDRHIAENTGCYVEISSIAELNALHAEWLAQSILPGFAPGRIQPTPIDGTGHGMREFHLWDPSGNLISFGAAL